MPMMSFSCRREQLMSGIKIETTRNWKYDHIQQMVKAIELGQPLKCWWEPRTKEKEKLFDAKIEMIEPIAFLPLSMDDPRPWPYKVTMLPQNDSQIMLLGDIVHMLDIEEAHTYMKNEGFDTMQSFIETLSGKNPNGIMGIPLIRIRFKNPNTPKYWIPNPVDAPFVPSPNWDDAIQGGQ